MKESEKQSPSTSERFPNYFEKYAARPINLILKNPQLTPKILLFLAVVPVVVLAIVLIIILPLQ
ncbi:MAG: hypothetical protein KME16_27015 [Scytolyngbya sp. HA4215-MV1]|nr:hypothetical protein [Scytolyngbya sp. HA4215-MV1]